MSCRANWTTPCSNSAQGKKRKRWERIIYFPFKDWLLNLENFRMQFGLRFDTEFAWNFDLISNFWFPQSCDSSENRFLFSSQLSYYLNLVREKDSLVKQSFKLCFGNFVPTNLQDVICNPWNSRISAAREAQNIWGGWVVGGGWLGVSISRIQKKVERFLRKVLWYFLCLEYPFLESFSQYHLDRFSFQFVTLKFY